MGTVATVIWKAGDVVAYKPHKGHVPPPVIAHIDAWEVRGTVIGPASYKDHYVVELAHFIDAEGEPNQEHLHVQLHADQMEPWL